MLGRESMTRPGKMKITTIAAKLRQVAIDMEIKAAMDGDWDYPDELVIPFIINAVTDKRMLEGRAAAAYLVRRTHA
jgi:hypothetical protein